MVGHENEGDGGRPEMSTSYYICSAFQMGNGPMDILGKCHGGSST